MSDSLKHECGIAMVRLRKPLAYYQDKYGTSLWGFHKLFLLMEKQHNRGQDGVGIGSCKLNMASGKPYIFRSRAAESESLTRIFNEQMERLDQMVRRDGLKEDDPVAVKDRFDFAGEVLLGHLRYGTSGVFGTGSCHPYVRRSNWQTRTLMVMGNFNMTNAAELNEKLIMRGQHPVFDTDTQTVLEEIGYHLDEAHSDIYRQLRGEGVPRNEIPQHISRDLDVAAIVRRAGQVWDGGYAIAGVVGNGDCFVARDPQGIRPAFYIENEEMVAFASERVPLMTVFDVEQDAVQEVTPGHVVVVKNDGGFGMERFADSEAVAPCSFERIYFSRGNDPGIYQERRALGEALVPQCLDAVDHDLDNTVFSFIPNTAEIAYHGMMGGLRNMHRRDVHDQLLEHLEGGSLDKGVIDKLMLENWPRGEKVAHKDIKMRTFISQEEGRNQLVSHVYDITYGAIKPDENLVVVDDSIVRGTTLKQSILKILSRLEPKQIVICSTAPQIRYPDCYGIDMSELGKFIAFQAAVALLKESGRQGLLDEVYHRCKAELKKPKSEMQNRVKAVYEPFSAEEISAKAAELVTPSDICWKGEVKMIFQTIENLHKAVPKHHGDWYFTGNYPTPGGYAVVNQAFIHYYEDRSGRAYDLFVEEAS